MLKREFPQQSINWGFQKENGQISYAYGLFMLLFLAIYLFAALKTEHFRVASVYLEDALTASNLASAIVDIEEFGISNTIRISDVDGAYEIYLDAVKGNLNLNDEWIAAEDGIVSGKVGVKRYVIYNVDGEKVQQINFDENGLKTESTGLLGTIIAPNNIKIESTSVYSEISFMVEIFPGKYVEAHKGSLVDVVE